MLRSVIVPLLATWMVFAGIALYAGRHPVPRPRGNARTPARRWLRGVATTVAAGYLTFLAIVLVFHVWIAGQHGSMSSAVSGGAFLAVCALVAFPVLSWIEARLRDGRSADRPE
jgi:hypothetical protein